MKRDDAETLGMQRARRYVRQMTENGLNSPHAERVAVDRICQELGRSLTKIAVRRIRRRLREERGFPMQAT